jgi:cellulose synthase/poly-beta-1,6-N-acetylglucosamine synthase-like glycosyltransferase
VIAAHALAAWPFAAAAAFLLLAAHPFVTYPLSLALLRRARPRPLEMQPMAAPPSVAVCVCAYNEAGVIGDRVRNILSLRPSCPGLQALVYVDGASDSTADILRGFGAEITAVISSQRLGKTYGMNTLVGLTQADIIVFSDANVSFAPDAITRLVAPFADPAVGCVCGHLRYLAADGHTAATGSLYWRLEEHIKALESATGSVMGADGSIFAIRRALHVPPPANLIDDMYVSLAILCGGARIVRAADAVAYEASVSTTAEEFRRKIRIACQAFNVHRALAPRLARLPAVDLYKYVSHKVLRWLSIFSLAASFACAAAGVAAWGGAAWLAGFLLLAGVAGGVLGVARRGPAARLREVLLALVATGLGVIRSLRGEKFQTWTPPASARAAADLTPEPV